uniref:Ig-like domain-containing protein n=1 Tax=Monopterus albus TaxID=43700 RepID=A0A3Q3IQM2_MONAL|nr:rano class II histocompatibility antigen, A beta chain-like isoform X2 [Monopterus albus]
MHISSFFSLVFLFSIFPRADALFGYALLRCQFTSTREVVYVEQLYFKKVLLLQYNSTLGNFTGYTDKTKKIADYLNKDQAFLKDEKRNEESCKSFVPIATDILSRPVEPYVRLRSVEAPGNRHPGMLMCSVYDFYPKQIRVTWLRNGEEVTSGVMSTDELSNGNWLYQIHSYLEYTPRFGETISCVVEHASLIKPKKYDWVPMPESEKNKIAVGTAGLLLGLIFLLAGLIYYKKNSIGRVLVPTS